MLDVAWPELMVVAAVTLVAVGPKDLPKVMNTLGKWVAKAKHATTELRQTYEQLSYEVAVAEEMEKTRAALNFREKPIEKSEDEKSSQQS